MVRLIDDGIARVDGELINAGLGCRRQTVLLPPSKQEEPGSVRRWSLVVGNVGDGRGAQKAERNNPAGQLL